MNKLKNFMTTTSGKVSTGLVLASASVLTTFAEVAPTPSVSTVIQTSMQTIVTDTLTTIAAVAPIGITIFGAMFCWKKGIQFFKNVTK